MSGLLKQLVVETDDYDSLVNTMRILMKFRTTISHYRTGVDANGDPFLVLAWYEHRDAIPFLSELTDPELVASNVYSWVTTQEYPSEPDTDGDISKGFLVSTRGEGIFPHSGYDIVYIRPVWIVYGK